MVLNGGVGALSKVLKAYIGEAAWPAKPTRGRTTRPSHVFAKCGGTIA